MRPINNWNEVKANEDFTRLPAGGYVCRIIRAEDNPEKEYLRIEYDIAEGEFKGYWQDTAERFDWWGGDFYRSYKDTETVKRMFKGFINCVEGSNEGYTWGWKEQTLEGKLIGILLGEEEYIKNDGSVGTRLKVRSTKTVQEIKDQRFRIPQMKKLEGASAPAAPAGFTPTDEDTPF